MAIQTMTNGLPLVACVVFGLALTIWAGNPPAPLGAESDATMFSAQRAMSDVEAIAQRPHPIGSREIVTVREYLLARLNSVGLQVSVRAGLGITTDRRAPSYAVAGNVKNIVGELAGTDPTLPAILLMAHYDTVPHSPGAADDSAGVAAAIEIARNLLASGPHKRTVLVLLTEGEEPGLLGASAFFDSDPLSQRVGIAFNLEARGDGGRVAMFETSPNNGELVRSYAKHVSDPSTDSLSVGLYRLMPNNSDLTVALSRSIRGMNFAFAEKQIGYHTQVSTPTHLDPRSLQHMGDQVLAMTRALADSEELPHEEADVVYSDVFGTAMILYPGGVGWVLLLFAGALLVFPVVRLRRANMASWREFSVGAQGLILLISANVLILQFCSRILSWLLLEETSEHALLGNIDLMRAGCLLVVIGTSACVIAALARGSARLWFCSAAAAVAVLSNAGGFDPISIAAGLVTIALGFFSVGRSVSTWGVWIGMIVLGAVLALVLQAIFPAGAYLVTWPVLVAAVAAFIVMITKQDLASPVAVVTIGVLGTLTLGHVAAQAAGFFTAVGAGFPAVIAPFAALATLVLLPLVHRTVAVPVSSIAALALLAVGLALVVATGVHSPATPRAAEAFYVADLDAERYYRASLLPNLDEWSRATLSSAGDEPKRVSWDPPFAGQVWVARAQPADFAKPRITTETIQTPAGNRLELRIQPFNRGRALRVWIRSNVDLAAAHIEGRPVPLQVKKEQWAEVGYYAPPEQGVAFSFEAPPLGTLDIRVAEIRDGWPEGLTPKPLPPGLMPWRHSDSTVLVDRREYSWGVAPPRASSAE